MSRLTQQAARFNNDPVNVPCAQHFSPPRLSLLIAPIRLAGQRDAAQREVDARRQSHRGHDHTQLARFGQGLDDPGPRTIAESAVMIADPALEHLGEMFPDQ